MHLMQQCENYHFLLLFGAETFLCKSCVPLLQDFGQTSHVPSLICLWGACPAILIDYKKEIRPFPGTANICAEI